MKKTNQLLQYVQKFFQDYMRAHRGMSPNTILAYRDAIKLFLRFLTSYTGKQASMLSLDYLQADAVLAFLENTETRGSSIATRNLRLIALRTFFGYLITQDTFRVGQYQRVIAIPLKQEPQPLVGYLEKDEVNAILDSIDQTIPTGRRDYILISLLHKTGARVQEICDLRGEDIYMSPRQ